MLNFKMPLALRWIWVVSFIILLMMTGYRYFLLAIFAKANTPQISILFQGLIFDAGIIAFFGLIFIATSFFKRLHPYRSTKGLYFSLGYFSFCLLGLLIVYAVDLVFIKTLGQRLTGTQFQTLIKAGAKRKLFVSNFPFLTCLIGLTLTCWVFWHLINRLHLQLGILERALKKSHRLAWHTVTIACFIAMIWNSIRLTLAYQIPEDVSLGRAIDTAIKANPIFSLLLL